MHILHRKVETALGARKKKEMEILHRDPVSITFLCLHDTRCVKINSKSLIFHFRITMQDSRTDEICTFEKFS